MAEPNPQFGTENPSHIIEAVHSRFVVSSEYIRDNSGAEFCLSDSQTEVKSKFVSLVRELRTSNLTAVLRRIDTGYSLVVSRKPIQTARQSKTPLVLLIVTLGTIFGDGIVKAYTYQGPFTQHLATLDALWSAAIYTAAIFGIISIHEMGHKVASWYHKMDSSWPYFIPGIPGIWPTMGAVITARDPPVNRDSLFDLGISGPIAGLVITIIVSFIAVFSARLVPTSLFPSSQQFGTSDYFTNFLIGLFRQGSSGEVVTGTTFTLLYFAYSFGFLLTFINLLPAWQLDGGHISNAAVTPRMHKWLTYLSVVIMVLIQFYLMAILILFFAGRAPALEPLDNVSPLSRKRKLFFALTWILAIGIFAFVLYNNAFFGLGLLFR